MTSSYDNFVLSGDEYFYYKGSFNAQLLDSVTKVSNKVNGNNEISVLRNLKLV